MIFTLPKYSIDGPCISPAPPSLLKLLHRQIDSPELRAYATVVASRQIRLQLLPSKYGHLQYLKDWSIELTLVRQKGLTFGHGFTYQFTFIPLCEQAQEWVYEHGPINLY